MRLRRRRVAKYAYGCALGRGVPGMRHRALCSTRPRASEEGGITERAIIPRARIWWEVRLQEMQVVAAMLKRLVTSDEVAQLILQAV